MDELLQSIYDEPDKWTLDRHLFRRGAIQIWICNGMLSVKTYEGPHLPFTMRDRRRFWRAFRWWCKNAPAEQLAGV